MATRARMVGREHGFSLTSSRHDLRPSSQSVDVRPHAGRPHAPKQRRVATKASVAPILAPPTLPTVSLPRPVAAVPMAGLSSSSSSSSTSSSSSSSSLAGIASAVVNNFPSPLAPAGMGTWGATTPPASNGAFSRLSTKKLLLSAIPGFFGVMGLGQFFEKRTKRGLFFLLAGGALSVLSSWYTIVPERIYSLVTGTAALPPYAVSWMSLFTGYNAGLGEALVIFLTFIPAMWGLQVYDSISPIGLPSPGKAPGKAPGVSLPAIPKAANIPHTMTHEEVEMSIRKLATDLQKERSLFSYLWER